MADEWVLIELDEKVSRMNGLPRRVPAPKAEFESIAESGFAIPRLKKWISAFLTAAPSAWRSQNADLAKSYDRFIAKADFWERGLAALSKRDVAGAIAAFKMIASVDPDDHAARLNLGLAYAQSGDATLAKKAFEAVRTSYEGDPDYHVAYGQAHLTTGDKDAAADEFALALEAKPDNMDALRALAGLGFLVAVYEDPKDAASLTFLRAGAELDSLKELWDQAPRDGRYYIDQLEYHASEGRHAVALAAAERAAANASVEVSERAELGRAAALRQLGRPGEAAEALSAALAKMPASSLLRVEQARVLFALGREADANRDLDTVLSADPGFMEALALRFPLERILSEASGGLLVDLARWAEGHPTAAGAWLWLGLHQRKAGGEDEALETLRKAALLAPGDDAVRSAYWTELGRSAKWQAVLDDAATLEMKSRAWTVRWNEAEALSALGRKVEARAAYGALNADESLPIEVRKRAKRAATRVGE